jgi:hypothetical protein
MALTMLAVSDATATGPRRLAEQLEGQLGLQVLHPPTESAPWRSTANATWTVSMVRREGAEASLDWFCDEIRDVA